jgi:hypothetical protein
MDQMGPPDATSVGAEELLRAWFHWWRNADDVPSKLPDGLHVATAAFLAALAVQRGQKIYGPHSI